MNDSSKSIYNNKNNNNTSKKCRMTHRIGKGSPHPVALGSRAMLLQRLPSRGFLGALAGLPAPLHVIVHTALVLTPSVSTHMLEEATKKVSDQP